ncbi:Ig-like domain-containing protein [Roseateles sp. GG27B]
MAPLLTVTTLANGDTLSGASQLGGIALGTGSDLTQLQYSFDSGNSRSLSFDAGSGSFGAALDFSNLGVGSHTLTVTARDAAGNTSVVNRTLTVDALAPFGLVSLTPADGGADVGVTQRPLVVFSRAVNTATLNSSTFYATGPDGSKLDATIVPSDSGSYAWLFFANPMPGAARITVHVDGSQIRAAADGTFLDADGDGVAGGAAAVSFTTVGQLSVSGTRLIGRVVDPGPDLLPMTFDDVRRGPDGVIHTADDVFLLPIAHAKVYILGQEANVVYTDANGYFTLDNIPAG